MKYITYEDREGYEHFVIFDELTNHSAMKQDGSKILGAGFVRIIESNECNGASDGDLSKSMELHCYGKSITLHIKSRDEKDSEILNE